MSIILYLFSCNLSPKKVNINNDFISVWSKKTVSSILKCCDERPQILDKGREKILELIKDSILVNAAIEIEEYVHTTYLTGDGFFYEAVLLIDEKETWFIQANLMKWKIIKLEPIVKDDFLIGDNGSCINYKQTTFLSDAIIYSKFLVKSDSLIIDKIIYPCLKKDSLGIPIPLDIDVAPIENKKQ